MRQGRVWRHPPAGVPFDDVAGTGSIRLAQLGSLTSALRHHHHRDAMSLLGPVGNPVTAQRSICAPMPTFVFHLYVFGQSQRSLRAASNLRRLCDQYLGQDYELTLIDVQAQQELAEAANIFATPVTVRVAPPPASRVVGDLSDPFKALPALGIEAVPTNPPSAPG
jgi:circadian clock protein KaiB